MTSETIPELPDSRLIMREIDISDCASKDATLDGTGSIFQSFKARLTQLAGMVTDNLVTGTVKEFGDWADKTRQNLESIAGEVPSKSDIFINSLDQATMSNLAVASSEYATKIVNLEKESRSWHKRFPELTLNLDKPQEKNGFLLGGVIFILFVVESVINSQFFAKGSEFGLLGGTLTAIAISSGNVLIPLGLALFGHRWFYQHDSYRSLGIVMIGLFLLWAFGFNHLVAQYRESLVLVAGTVPGTDDIDSSTLNYVLLFALGAAVAGISFWKMWFFLDPFKHARKCIDDLNDAKEEFKNAVCDDLRVAEKRFNDINSEINKMGKIIPGKFEQTEAEFKHIHSNAIDKTNRLFSIYHSEYCVIKVDPDPDCPVITPETATEHNVGIRNADWVFFNDIKVLLNKSVDTATQEWVPKLDDILAKINDLIKRFTDVITARLLEWQNQP